MRQSAETLARESWARSESLLDVDTQSKGMEDKALDARGSGPRESSNKAKLDFKLDFGIFPNWVK